MILAAFVILFVLKNWGTDRFVLRGAMTYLGFFGFAAIGTIAWQVALGRVWPWKETAIVMMAHLVSVAFAIQMAKITLWF